jgi:2-(1,2-epoxy-1,2-dihydrophenyl)acetyl-CoA isomerase
MSEFEFLICEQRGGVAWLTLNRPHKLNAVHPPMRQELFSALDWMRGDPSVRCIVVTGAGRSFCSGADISQRFYPSPIEGEEGNQFHARTSDFRWGWQRIIETMWESEKPIIAAVNGWAVGFGCQLALYSDLVIASDAAQFQEVFARRGLPMEAGGSFILPRTMSMVQAKEAAFFADTIPAEDALRLGMVNRVVPPGQLIPLAEQWADRLANGPTRVLGMHKRLLQSALDSTMQRSFQDEINALALLTGSTDSREAIAAFRERRDPEFTGG